MTHQHNIDYDSVGNITSTFEVCLGTQPSIRSAYLQRRTQLHDKQKHLQLQADLVELILECFGNENNN